MSFYLYNTLTRKKEEFTPINENNVCMYVCGPTVYDRAHIGNAKTGVVFDTLFRVLREYYGKTNVRYASNITDIDDKIINKAIETGKQISEITEETFKWYVEDMSELNVLEPTHRPKATEFVPEMIELVEILIQKGHAYESDGHVLFDTSSMDNYGYLSRRSLDDMVAGARVEVASYKKNAADFILWKPSDEAQPGWKSPWGFGRPGWHLECSVMSSKYLGNSFDIHGGGSDLIFPHHENECAQSMCAHPNDSYAKYWLHAGMLNVDGVKMSKSLGNFFTVQDILAKFHGETLRFAFLSTHYHQPMNFTHEGLNAAKQALDKFYTALRNVADIPFDENAGVNEDLLKALTDDVNTPLAISVLHEITAKLNKADNDSDKSKLKTELVKSAYLLGVLEQKVEDWFKWSPKATEGNISDADIDVLVNQRTEAKKNKDWGKADEIRNQLKDLSIALEDTASGTIWKRV